MHVRSVFETQAMQTFCCCVVVIPAEMTWCRRWGGRGRGRRVCGRRRGRYNWRRGGRRCHGRTRRGHRYARALRHSMTVKQARR